MVDETSGDGRAMPRREFLYCAAGTLASVSLGTLSPVVFGAISEGAPIRRYPIDATASTTLQRMLAFPKAVRAPGLAATELSQVSRYGEFGYGDWTFGSGLPVVRRTDLMPGTYRDPSPARNRKLLSFFAISDIHITDKEAPNQLIHFQQAEPAAANNTSIYSPVMLYTTHVLDAAIQTVNALHRRNPFDFGISLGDTCNSTSYNELRWYIDVIDGKVITPSSGAHVGADTVDYQKPYQAAGLDASIPWYQVLGNHDHFFIGSFPVDADPSLGIRQSYVADSVWSVADILDPDLRKFPILFDMTNLKAAPAYYAGRLDGSTRYGTIVDAGPVADPRFAAGSPKVVADPDRRSLLRSEWVQEFFNTRTRPVGHGFNLVDQSNPARKSDGFACYTFVPNAKVPLKVIVLDDTQSETDGSTDIHGHGYLDADRWAWLQAELARGQAANQLMIIAAHIPIAVSAIGSETEWWLGEPTTAARNMNAASLDTLVKVLQNTPNLLLWLAGHRHLNAVKAFVSPDPARPEQGFWQVETSSLRDFPQQFRTFEIFLNADYTVSIVTTNVDPAVAEGTPAATSRRYAIAVQQIVRGNVNQSNQNFATVNGGGRYPLPSMDPTRPQTDAANSPDPTIRYVDMTQPGFPSPVPVNGSYNGELLVPVSPQMAARLKAQFPQPA